MVYTIMSQTLPTIVGMGVVSRTTEVMFDKRGRPIPKKTAKGPKKRFDGKVYHRSAKFWKRKSSAQSVAKSLRDAGYKARVHYDGNRYWVYWRN